MIDELSLSSLWKNFTIFSSIQLSQITTFFSRYYFYLLIIIVLLILLSFILHIYLSKRKKQKLERIYRKLSESDQQIVQVVLLAEKESLSNFKNIYRLIYSTTHQEIGAQQLQLSLNRLEKVGIINKFVYNKNGINTHLWKVSPKAHSIVRPKLSRLGFIPLIFLPMAIFCVPITYFLLGFLDSVVHGDLYSHGLVFSYEWAGDYWNITGLIRTSFLITGILITISLIIAIIILRNSGLEIKYLACAILISGIAFLSYSLFLFIQLDGIVNNTLYNFGLNFSYQWFDKYSYYLILVESLLLIAISSNLISFFSCLFAKPRNQIS